MAETKKDALAAFAPEFLNATPANLPGFGLQGTCPLPPYQKINRALYGP
jgi:hypothetical protein